MSRIATYKRNSSGASWTNASGGNWNTAADWSDAAVPGASTEVTIAAAGTYTVEIDRAASAGGVLLDSVGATLLIERGQLALGGVFDLASGTLTLLGGLDGGTLACTGGDLLSADGALNGVTIEGALDLSLDPQSPVNDLQLNGRTIFEGAGGSGAGTLILGGELTSVSVNGPIRGLGLLKMQSDNEGSSGDTVTFANSVDFGAITMVLGAAGGSTDNIDLDGSSYVFGAGSLIEQEGAGSGVGLTFWGNGTPQIVDDGTIAATQAGALSLFGVGDSPTLTNNGLLEVSNGSTLYVDIGGLINNGVISASGTDTMLDLYVSTLSGSGSILLDGASLALSGALSSATLDSITNDGGQIAFDGVTLSNTGTLLVGAGTSFGTIGFNSHSAINGGVIKDSGGGLDATYGTLSNLTYQGTLSFDTFGGALTFDNVTMAGLDGTGGGTILLGPSLETLTVLGSFSGASKIAVKNSSIIFGNSATLNNGEMYLVDGASIQGRVAFGSDYAVHVGYGDVELSGTFSNAGTIETTGGTEQFSINFLQKYGSFSNGGTLAITGRSNVIVGGAGFTNSGVIKLDGNGADLLIQLASPGYVLSNTGTILNDGGTITLAGNLTDADLAIFAGESTGTIGIAGTLVNSGMLSIGPGLSYGVVSLGDTSLLTGGVIETEIGGFQSTGGTCASVTFEGKLAVDYGQTLTVTGDTRIEGIGGQGAGDLSIFNGLMQIEGTASIGHAAVLGELDLDGASVDAASVVIGKSGVMFGTGTVAGRVHILNDGAIEPNNLVFTGPVVNDGLVLFFSSTPTVARFAQELTGNGTIGLGGLGTMVLEQGASSGQLVDFTLGQATLSLAHPLDFAGVIEGFGQSDVIDLLNQSATGFTLSGDTLTVLNNGSAVANLLFQGSYTQSDFALVSDNHGGTRVQFV